MRSGARSAVLLVSVALIISLIPAGICIAWSNDPAVNTPVSMAFDHQNNHQITSDGSGGAIITWQDYRDRYGTMSDIYAQRIDRTGKVLWTLDGVVVSLALNDQLNPEIVSDGSGGAIIMWEDSRNGNIDIYAQRVNSNGSVLWQTDGVAICTNPYTQENPQIISDGEGGAIITWSDGRGSNAAIFAQRINASGNVLWVADGVAVSEASYGHYPEIVSDGMGGAIISWTYRVEDDIRAQRIDPNGITLWAAGGVAISTGAAGPQNIRMERDSNGGTIMAWEDFRNGGGGSDIYAQGINADGKVKWPSDVLVRNAIYGQENPQITSDGGGGAVITWLNTQDGKVYVQKISGNGILQWKANGVAVVSTPPSHQLISPQIVGDGKGGAIITWEDYTGVHHVHAQRVSRDGKVMWPKDGVAISTAIGGDQFGPQLVRDGHGGAIIVFGDQRNGTANTDVYAQKVSAKGQLQPVQVFSPNGGEVIASGLTDEPIEWGAPTEAIRFKLLYSTDNGLTWKSIAEDIPGTTHPWNVPVQAGNKTKCRIKVIGYDASNVKVGADVSDAPFTIEVVKLTFPNGGTLVSGTPIEIAWTSNQTMRDVTKVVLSYTTNGGTTWKPIETLSGSYLPGLHTSSPWTVPSVGISPKTKCKVKVVLKDAEEKTVGSDTSDAFFTITP